jgi:RAD3-like DEAD/DEAH box helicase/helicase-like protein
MNAEEIRQHLADRNQIERSPFELLKAIAFLFNTDDENICRDLALRALENRQAFGRFEPILTGLIRELGLFPYLQEDQLSLADTIAFEYHRPLNLEEPMVFHREQAEIYRRLLNGESIILSAPTSFGKSKVIDGVIATRRYKNIVVIVPTIALIDETRRRLSSFSPEFKIVTQLSQEPGEQNIFVFTAERAIAYEQLPRIEFFIIDEFYKIGALTEDPRRTAALNQAFYRLSKAGGQFYLLGPSVRQIPEGFEKRFRCTFYPTSFATVASEEIRVNADAGDIQALNQVVSTLRDDPTLIYCRSPRSANNVAQALLKAEVTSAAPGLASATNWMRQNYHPDWTLPAALQRGIAMHHGKLPRSLAQYLVRAFNDSNINVLACTSTLIEGVNTKAKNVIIFDNIIARKKLDFFTFNNIRGRSGRMFQHFVGRVFLFHEPPTEELPFVDFPVFTQGVDTPDSVLLQIDRDDLSSNSRNRMEPFISQTDLPIEIMRRHPSVEPTALLDLVQRLKRSTPQERALLSWTRFPSWQSLRLTCELIWDHLVPENRLAGVSSGAQLAVRLLRLRQTPKISQRIASELIPGQYAAETPDEAVERVLEFDRTWASFELPRLLRAFSAVRSHVLEGPGNYSFYASQVENLFRQPFQVALEEFGLPLQITDKLGSMLANVGSLDSALDRIRHLSPDSLELDSFEAELLIDCQSVI